MPCQSHVTGDRFKKILAVVLFPRRTSSRRRRGVGGLQERDNLPAACVGEIGPGRHTGAEIAVREQPEEVTGRGPAHGDAVQWGSAASAMPVLAVAARAMARDELATRANGIRIP